MITLINPDIFTIHKDLRLGSEYRNSANAL